MSENYSIPQECSKLLQSSILNNPKAKVPEEVKQLASKVKFVGIDEPSIPVSIRFAESISVLKALEGLTLTNLIQKKYKTEIDTLTINTDHAQGFVFSPVVVSFVDENKKMLTPSDPKSFHEFYNKHFKDMDIYKNNTPYNFCTTNIYRTKDDRFYHIHGSINAKTTQQAIGVSPEPIKPDMTFEEVWPIYADAVKKFTAEELDTLSNDVNGQAGTICYTQEEFKQTEQYKANQHVGLYESHFVDDGSPAQWWKLEDMGSVERPLKGLKVLDLTRIIAAPVISRTLAEYGASIMHVTSPNLPDFSALHADMNFGKWCSELDFHKEEDRQKLRALIEEADVVVEGYRPFHLDKYGLGRENLLDIAKKRGRGIIYVRENCYGWNGPWVGRTGWQQISDACCGISYMYGRSLGLDEPITPVLPNSDFCTGSIGATAVIQALVDRSTKGGSYVIDTALNYYNTWLGDYIGAYEDRVWQKLWESKGKPSPRHYYHMLASLPLILGAMKQHSPAVWNPEFFEEREMVKTTARVRAYKPVVQFSNNTKPGFDIPTRGSGVDAPYWPKDLNTKVVEA